MTDKTKRAGRALTEDFARSRPLRCPHRPKRHCEFQSTLRRLTPSPVQR